MEKGTTVNYEHYQQYCEDVKINHWVDRDACNGENNELSQALRLSWVSPTKRQTLDEE